MAFFSTGITAATFHTSLSALALSVAAPRNAVAAAAVMVTMSPGVRTLTAEAMAAARWSRSAPRDSAASTHWAATSVAADATAMSVRAARSSLPPPEAAVAAATAATAAATAATDTAAWTCALCARASSFFFSFLSFSHRPTVFPPPPTTPRYGCGFGVLTALQNLLSSTSGETGGLSESEPPPLRGPLLCERRPEVSGDTSCDCDMILSMMSCEVAADAKEKELPEAEPSTSSSPETSSAMTAADAAAAGKAAAASARRETSAAPDALHDRDRNSSAGSRGSSGGRSSPLPPPAVTLPDSLIGAVALVVGGERWRRAWAR
ncbi:Os12g0604300, partial [Oryza sativa Japonica Group]